LDVRARRSNRVTSWRLATCALASLAFCVLPVFDTLAMPAVEATQGAPAKSITVSGSLRNAGGEPISGADVYLDSEKKPALAHDVSGDDGRFKLTIDRAGTYTVRAEKSGWTGDQSDPIELPRDANKSVDLVMENSRNPSANSGKSTTASSTPTKTATPANSANGIEFSDEPSFTVAGVTDRSNLGLHGSDTTARTSDTLARETARLKGEDADKAGHTNTAMTPKYQSAIELESKGDLAGARDLTQKTLATGDDAEGHHLLADFDEKMNDPLGAVREYERAARMYPSEQNYFDWGSELLLHKAAQPALEVFSKGVSLHPQSSRMFAGLGAAQYAELAYEDAARSLCKASDLKPNESAPYLFLGRMEKTVKTPLPCAREKLGQFVEMQPANAAANYYYAISLIKRDKNMHDGHNSEQVKSLLGKSEQLDPKYRAVAFLELGVLEYEQGAFAPAIQCYQRALQADPELSEVHYRLALSYKRAGDDQGAKREMDAYQAAEKAESAKSEEQNRELKQFLVILKSQPATQNPHP
jgi:tetratricopeptide (TPR) repeat protein